MTRRSVPGSISFNAHAGTLNDFFDHHEMSGERWWFWDNTAD
jgi:hypothetical protein